MSIDRDQILTCACDLYHDKGLEGFSMRSLARSVGVTAPALYRHYEGKEAVLLDVVSEAYKVLSQYLYRALSGSDPMERFHRAGEGYLDFALENPRLYEMIYIAPDFLGREEFPEEIVAQGCAIGQFWNDRVRECMDAGLLKEDDPEEVSLTMWGMAHGLVSIYLRGSLPVSREEFRRLFKDAGRRAFQGLGTERYARELNRRMTEEAAETG